MTKPFTEAEIDYARRLAGKHQEKRLPPGSGIVIGLVGGSILWAVAGLVVYFTFFN